MITTRDVYNKYPFLKICEYCRILSKIYYSQAVAKLEENYRLFNEEESEEHSGDYRDRLEKSIANTKYILQGLNIQPFNLVLTERASVQLEYEMFNFYLELEVFPEEIKCLASSDRYNYSSYQKINLSIYESHRLSDILDNFFYGEKIHLI